MDNEQIAIARLQDAARLAEHRYHEPLVVTYSGGKDSQVLVTLAERAGIAFRAVHNLTTADAPETMYFIRDQFKEMEERGIPCKIEPPRYKGLPTSMWKLIPQKGIPPTRVKRYCCEILKERNTCGKFIATGVRWAESARRTNSRGIFEANNRNKEKRILLMDDNDERRREFESCNLKGRMTCNPIVDWETNEIWDYMDAEKLPKNPLYCEGFLRVSCIGCALANLRQRQMEFARWPKYEQLYLTAFDQMLKVREAAGKMKGLFRMGTTAIDVFHWWMEDGVLPGQLSFDDYINDEEANDDD